MSQHRRRRTHPGTPMQHGQFRGTPYVGAAVGSTVRLCSIVSAFPLPCFSAETAFRKRPGNALMTEKPNDGASLTRVGATVNTRLGQLFQFCRERRCLRDGSLLAMGIPVVLAMGIPVDRPMIGGGSLLRLAMHPESLRRALVG